MNKYITSLIRHGFTVAAGYLLAKGVAVPPEAVDSLATGTAEVVGSLLTFGGIVVWSWIEKAKSKLPRF